MARPRRFRRGRGVVALQPLTDADRVRRRFPAARTYEAEPGEWHCLAMNGSGNILAVGNSAADAWRNAAEAMRNSP